MTALFAAPLVRVAGALLVADFGLCAALLGHAFPYNVRELFTFASQLRVETPTGELYDLLPIADRLEQTAPTEVLLNSHDGTGPNRQTQRPAAPSREEFTALLSRHRGNVSSIARAMGRSRRQIDRWLESMQLEGKDFRS